MGYHLSMAKLLGLDVSTTYVGACLIDLDKPIDEVNASHLVWWDHIEFKKANGKSTWTKADHVRSTFALWARKPEFKELSNVYIEAALMRFTPGMSSMQAIASLLRFNGIVSYLVHDVFSIEPTHITVGEARKLCGLKMQQKKNAGGMGHKEQTAQHFIAHDLQTITWPTKKNGKPVDWRFDVIDAYCIARAGCALNT